MKIETTFNVAPHVRERIDGAARKAEVTKSALIVMLLNRVMKEHRHLVVGWRAVRYQERDPARKWCRVHVSLWSRDYEFCLDSRKLFKRSLSLLVAFAVENYLDEILGNDKHEKDLCNTDNYTFNSYLLMCDIIGDSICWRIYWNLPPKPGKIFSK